MSDKIPEYMAKKKENIVINDTKKKMPRHLVTTLIGACILIVGYLVFIRPVQITIRELDESSSIDDLRNSITQKRQLLSRMERVFAQAEGFSPSVSDKVNTGMPDNPDLSNALINIVSLFEDSGLEVVRVGFSEVESKPSDIVAKSEIGQKQSSIKEVGVRVSVNNMNYTTLKRFLSNAERSLRLVRVDKFSFGVDQTVGVFELTIFYLP